MLTIFGLIAGAEAVSRTIVWTEAVMRAAFESTLIKKILEEQHWTTTSITLFAFCAASVSYLVDRVVIAVAVLLPLNLAYNVADMLSSHPVLREIWMRHHQVSSNRRAISLFDWYLNKLRASDRKYLVEGADHWKETSSSSYLNFVLMKFLMIWALICAAVATAVFHRGLVGTSMRCGAVLVVLAIIGLGVAMAFVRATEQMHLAKAEAVLAFLQSEPLPSTSVDKLRSAEIDEAVAVSWSQRPGWWWITFGNLGILSYLKAYRRVPPSERAATTEPPTKAPRNIERG